MEFTSKVTSRISTVNLERQLLHVLMTNKFTLQSLVGKHKRDYFQSRSRLFIYDCIRRLFDDKHCVLTKELFDFELEKSFDSVKDKVKIDDYTAEFDIVKKTVVSDAPETILSKFREIEIGNQTEQALRDIYAKLNEGNYDEAVSIMRQRAMEIRNDKEEGRIVNVYGEASEILNKIQERHDHPELFAGIPTGFEKFDRNTGGLFPAELTVVFGLSGKGKSTFMKAMTCNIRKQGRVVLHCGNEENLFQMWLKYLSADSGERYFPLKNGKYDDESFGRLKKFCDDAKGVGAIYLFEFPQQTDATCIERAYRELEMQGVKVDCIVVDYLDLMSPIHKAYSENDEGGKVTSDLKQLAINCKCPVVTATQAGTQSEKQEKKANPFLTQADVFGTKRKVHSANTLIGIVNQTATAMANDLPQEERKLHRMVLCVPKNRDGAIFTFRQIMDSECGRFYEDTDTNDAAYNALEKQAAEMINDTAPLGRQRTEIDMKEIVQAQKEELEQKLYALNEKIQGEQSNAVDDFVNEGSDTPIEEESETQEQNEEGNAEDDFLNDAPAVIEEPGRGQSNSDSGSAIEESQEAIPNSISETKTPKQEIVEQELRVAEKNGVKPMTLKEFAALAKKKF